MPGRLESGKSKTRLRSVVKKPDPPATPTAPPSKSISLKKKDREKKTLKE